MRQRFAAALMILAASALMQSCGQTGPLYMPDKPAPSGGAAAAGAQDRPETATEAAAEADPTPVN